MTTPSSSSSSSSRRVLFIRNTIRALALAALAKRRTGGFLRGGTLEERGSAAALGRDRDVCQGFALRAGGGVGLFRQAAKLCCQGAVATRDVTLNPSQGRCLIGIHRRDILIIVFRRILLSSTGQ